MYIYIFIYIYTYKYVYICTCIYIYTHTILSDTSNGTFMQWLFDTIYGALLVEL